MNAIEPVEIVLDKPRKMLLTMGALRKAEAELNRARGLNGAERVSIFEVINREIQGFATDQLKLGADFIVILLWASLLHEEKALTLDEVESFPGRPVEILAGLVACINRSFSEKKEAQGEGDSSTRPLDQLNGSISGHSRESN